MEADGDKATADMPKRLIDLRPPAAYDTQSYGFSVRPVQAKVGLRAGASPQLASQTTKYCAKEVQEWHAESFLIKASLTALPPRMPTFDLRYLRITHASYLSRATN